MKKFSVIIITICLIFSCDSKQKFKDEKYEETIKLVEMNELKSDTINEPNYITIFDRETGKHTKLTNEEIKIININLVNAVNKYNEDLNVKIKEWNKNKNDHYWNLDEEKIDLRYYFRQYFIYKNKNGDKIVEVFCFCNYFEGWKNHEYIVHDGGDCYLNAVINITNNKTEYFGTNGLA